MVAEKQVAPYGAWKSPITSSLIVAQSIALMEVRLDGDDIYWLEGRPQERGRYVVVRAPAALTPAPADAEHNWRYADGVIDRRRKRWIGVREDHTDASKPYPDNTIVAVPLDGPASDPGRVLASGHDFFSSPRLSPDGRRLAYLAWDHPNMPWVGTTLYVAELGDD